MRIFYCVKKDIKLRESINGNEITRFIDQTKSHRSNRLIPQSALLSRFRDVIDKVCSVQQLLGA
jgi:hypothetical protein